MYDPANQMADHIYQTLLLGLRPLAAIIILPFFLTFIYAFYNAFLHPLRGFPGPLLWRSFRFPYVVSIQRGILHSQLRDFHARYGSVVRIAPNELSYADGRAWKDIYANRPGHLPFERNRTWFKKMQPDEPNSIMGFVEEDHTRYRRAFSNAFSDRSLKEQAPVVESYVDLFIRQLKALALDQSENEKIVNLEKWFNYLTFDISGDFTYGESFDCVKEGKEHPWVAVTKDFGKGLAMIASVNQYRPIDKFLRFIIPKSILQTSINHRELSYAKARKRIAQNIERPDWVSPTQKFNEQKGSLTDAEWGINLLIIAFGASETTASTLTAITRELVQHKGVLHRLTREIRAAFKNESDIKIASVTNLEYLDAVINEGMRLNPAVVVGVPRIVPKGGDTVCGKLLPEGTYVAFNQFSAYRQTYNFRNPNSFVPERFLASSRDEKDDMSAFQPFQVGRHTCIGLRVAYSELRLVLARLLWSFDLQLADENDRWDWGDQKSSILWDKKPLEVILRHAERSRMQQS